MADYDLRLPLDYKFGTLVTSVDNVATELTSEAFRSFPSDLSLEKYVPVALVDEVNGSYEVVWVTGHAADSNVVTVARGREGSNASAWSSGTVWRVSASVRDAVQALPSELWPADPHLGMRVVDSADGQNYIRTNTGWSPFPYVDNGTLIGEVELSSPSTGVTWFDIPQNYRHLVLYHAAKTTDSSFHTTRVYFNGDTAANYDLQGVVFEGSGVRSFRFNGVNGIESGPISPTIMGSSVTVFPNYSGATNIKTCITNATYMQAPGALKLWNGAGVRWSQGTPITQLQLACTASNFAAGSYMGLYGVK